MIQDPISQARLLGVHPVLAAKVNRAAAALAARGIYFRVAQGLRTYAMSDADFALGRTVMTKPDGSPQGIVTEARGGFSWHNFGMAVDCYPFLVACTYQLDWNAESPLFEAMVAALKAEGLAWGGDWETLKDYPHFQLADVAVTPTDADRAAFAAGGIQAVWAMYHGGEVEPPN
jgi:peptidoglycan L-alanyl-D-glutamate endopeptidase CwlK